ncbi:hypothetical protein [Gemmobacter caeruleus]|nr:hypothetical protein [Gemmobacter caeruleus]
MSNSIRITLAVCTLAFLAACGGAKQDEVVYVDEPAVSNEPVFTGKYK